MPTNITISNLGGSSPFDVYVCDPTKVVDDNDCIITSNLSV